MKVVECDNCGSEIKRYQCNINDNNFCDMECKKKWQTGKVPWCEYEELNDPEWIRERHHNRGMTYGEIAEELGCSQSNVFKRAKQHGIEPQREKYVKLADPEWLKEHNHDKGLRLYEIANLIGCTRSAVGFAMRRHGIEIERYMVSGEDSPWWKEDYDRYYGPNWQEIRQEVRERDNFECQDCGTPESELDIPLHVHHIQPKRTFDSLEEANNRENLVSLCQPCHNKWEGIPLKPDNR